MKLSGQALDRCPHQQRKSTQRHQGCQPKNTGHVQRKQETPPPASQEQSPQRKRPHDILILRLQLQRAKRTSPYCLSQPACSVPSDRSSQRMPADGRGGPHAESTSQPHMDDSTRTRYLKRSDLMRQRRHRKAWGSGEGTCRINVFAVYK